jgi:hypothetical protein
MEDRSHFSDSSGLRALWMQPFKLLECLDFKKVSNCPVAVRLCLWLVSSLRTPLIGKEGRADSQIYGCRKSAAQRSPHRF